MELMNLDQEHWGIPETNYACNIRIPSLEFARIYRDLSQFSESMDIACYICPFLMRFFFLVLIAFFSLSTEGVKFSVKGDETANEKLVQTPEIDKKEKAVKCMDQFYLAPKIEDEES